MVCIVVTDDVIGRNVELMMADGVMDDERTFMRYEKK